MAKRVSPEEKPWNPVEERLAKETLRPSFASDATTEQAAAATLPPAPSTARVVKIADHQVAPTVSVTEESEPKKDEVEPVEKLSREKRVLLTESEEDALEQLVKDMSRRLRTPIKLSHLLRATSLLLNHSRDELLKQSEKMAGMKRPSNKDAVALAAFEHNLARLVDRAIRGSRLVD